MSAAIYHGYKVPLSMLGEAVEWFHISMWRRVVKSFTPSNMDELRKLREHHAECGFHVWIDAREQEALICLFGLPIYTDSKRTGCATWKFPSWIEEFSYWDNTDPPEGMRHGDAYKRWKARGAQWNRVALDGGHWEERMTMCVLPKDGFRDMDLAAELFARHREAWEIKPSSLLSKRRLPK